MLKQTKFLILMLIFSVFALLVSGSPVIAEEGFVIKNIVTDDAGNLLVINGKNTGNVADYKVTKLDGPDRLVVDMPNTVLIGPRRTLNISNSGILNVKVAQFSVNPDIVRLVFTSDSKDAIRGLSFHKSENTLIFNMNKFPVRKYTAPTVYQDKDMDNSADISKIGCKNNDTAIQSINNLKNYNQDMVISNIKAESTSLTLSGAGKISIKEPFVLTNPTRLVIDIQDATVSSLDMLKNYIMANTDIIRIGRNSPDTLRVVVETNDPDNYKTIISPDLQTLIIASKSGVNLAQLPDNNNISNIQDINIKQNDGNTTTLTFTATQPMIHNVRHLYRPNRINLELYNVNAPKKTLISALPKTGQFQGINIDYIEKYPQGSSWSLPIKRGTKVESKLSMDGKSLELSINSPKYTPAVRGKVIVDPGHGGTEPGAQRNSIYEKNITLDVAKKVYKYLYDAGVDVIMTREGDDTVSLKDRTVIANNENPDCFVSIHVNACDSPGIKGIETHMYTPQSQDLARIMQNSLVNAVNSPNRGVLTSRFYVINHTNAPSVLVEIGFISNDNERTQLLTDDRQETTAKAIANGILQYLGIKPR